MSELNKQQLASEKLDAELKKAKEKDFAEPITAYLKERIADDEGLAEDVLKKEKSWSGCFEFIYSMAKKTAGGKRAIGISHETVFEWAEDYFRKEDKDLKNTKPAKKASGKKQEKTKASSDITKTVDNVDKNVDKQTDIVSKQQEKPKKQNKKKEDMSCQMSIFDLFGGLDG